MERPCRFTLGETISGTHWIGNWVKFRAGLDEVEKRKKALPLHGIEPRSSSL
jgi:hypothetical protein